MDTRGPQLMSQERPADQENHHMLNDTNDAEDERAAQLLSTNKQIEFLDLVRQLKQCLDEKTSECGLLRVKLLESDQQAEMLSRELDGCKLAIFQNNEDSKKLHEEVTRSKKLEEDYVELMSNYLDLEKRYEQHRQNLYDSYLAKTNAINNYECTMSREVMKHELVECREELNQKTAQLSLVSAKLRNIEEESSTKENCISELTKSLDDAKVAHKHEITVLEEYIQCLKNTITSYEKTLASYLDNRQHRRDEPEMDVSLAEGHDQAEGMVNTPNTNIVAQINESGDI